MDHIESVKSNVPPEKLLVYDVRQGWEPLCNFLGVAVPQKPFPHLHDAHTYLNYIRKVKIWMALAGITAFSAILLILLYLFL